MRKELTVYIGTNEPDEEIKVMRVKDDPTFYILTIGGMRIVVNMAELFDAAGAIGHYATLFDQEERMRAMRDKTPPPRVVEVEAPGPNARKKTNVYLEDEDTLVLETQVRTGPTASELALEQQTQHMLGDSLVLKEK